MDGSFCINLYAREEAHRVTASAEESSSEFRQLNLSSSFISSGELVENIVSGRGNKEKLNKEKREYVF